jgi:hypothetical protein
MIQKFAAIIWPLMVIQKTKFWNGLKHKPKNVSKPHGQTFDTISKSNVPVSSAEDELIPSFYVTERIQLKQKVHHKETRDWKFYVLSWTKRYAACDNAPRG